MHLSRFIPIMWLPPLAYLLVALSLGGDAGEWFTADAFVVPLPSGDEWRGSRSAIFIMFALVCLAWELIRTALPSGRSLVVNSLIGVALVPCIVLFVLVKGFGTTEFFLVMLMMLLDFLINTVVQIFTARRTIGWDPTDVP